MARSGLPASKTDAAMESRLPHLPTPSSLLHATVLVESWKHVFRPLHVVSLREVREREFLEIRGAPRHCAGTVQSD